MTKTMTFLEYQMLCPFCKYGLMEGYLDKFELTCRRKDNIPPGHSWGRCDERYCPEFGVEIKMTDIVARDPKTGEVIFTADTGKMRMVLKEE